VHLFFRQDQEFRIMSRLVYIGDTARNGIKKDIIPKGAAESNEEPVSPHTRGAARENQSECGV
jgi:hypothetical protein